MTSQQEKLAALKFAPLTTDRWADFEELFGERGACGGCWCMWWRLKRAEFERQRGEDNRQAMRAIVEAGEVPGLLAYAAGRPIAWCAVAPRDRLPALERSRILKRVDAMPVWSVACFFVNRTYRNGGVTVALLRAAVDYVRQQGGKVVEGYPVEPKNRLPDTFVWTGLASAFRAAGFVECLRRSETRPIVRFYIGNEPGCR